MKRVFRADTETFPLRAGLSCPRLVCLQYAYDDDEPRIVLRDDGAEEVLLEALSDPQVALEFHNGSFDQVVTAAAFPGLLPLWFHALGSGRGRDTLLRAQLAENARGTLQDNHPKGHWSLGGLAERLCGIHLDKGEESWRLRYALLDGVPVADWPEDARRYALEDITSLRAVSKRLNQDHVSPDEWFQVAAGFVLNLAATWGLRTDPKKIDWSEMCLMSEAQECRAVLEGAKFLNEEGSVNKKSVQEAIEKACAKAKITVPKTNPSSKFPEGQTKTDADTCESLKAHDSTLTALSRHTTAVKMRSTYLTPLKPGAITAVTSRPNTLVASGRTSWGGSKLTRTNPWWPALPEGAHYEKIVDVVGGNWQNQPQLYGIRECVVPRPGYYFASVDYSSLELRTLGQACLWICGNSTFARGYQQDPDWDPHSYFGGTLVGINYAEAIQRKKTDKTFKNGPRKIAKSLNFSLGGGVGAKRFAEMSVPLYEAGELPEPITVQKAYQYKEQWLDAFPEMRDYFQYVSWLQETGKPLRQFVSSRMRGRIGYTDGCNSFFQGLGADAAKRALVAVSQACYTESKSPLFGSRVLAFIHDEIFAEVPIPTAHEAAMEIVRLMNREFSVVCPDVPPAAEPALMTHWTKAAEPKFQNGRLIPWA